MGAIEFKSPGDFSAAKVGFRPPVTAGLEYWGWLGGSAAESVRNHAPGKLDGVWSSVLPLFSPGYMSVDGDTSWLDLQVAETADITICLIGRATGALTTTADNQDESAYFVSNYSDKSAVDQSRNAPGITICAMRSNQISVRASAWSGSAVVVGNVNYALDPMSWGYMDVTLQATGALSHARTVRHKTQNFSVSTTSASAREPNIRGLRVGDAASSLSGKLDVAFVAVFSRALSVEEKDAVYAVVKAASALSRRGSIII